MEPDPDRILHPAFAMFLLTGTVLARLESGVRSFQTSKTASPRAKGASPAAS
jgi:hypothetical protein